MRDKVLKRGSAHHTEEKEELPVEAKNIQDSDSSGLVGGTNPQIWRSVVDVVIMRQAEAGGYRKDMASNDQTPRDKVSVTSGNSL